MSVFQRSVSVVFPFLLLVGGLTLLGAEELNVLMIGNSFSQSLFGMLEPVAESVPDCRIHLEGIVIPGCSLEQHWNNILAEEADRDSRFFPDFTYREKLESRPWDYVTLQQKSPISWIAGSYWPWAGDLTGYIRKYAPTAEPVIQQTWSYRPDDRRLSEWNMTQSEMDEKVFAAYRQAAEKLGLRVIPVGLAVKLARAEQPGGYQAFHPADYTYPDLPDINRYFTGQLFWSKDKTRIEGDTYHLNLRGRYLQACVWFAFLFGRSAEEITYVPEGITGEDARFMRRVADEAIQRYR
ncbi:MAG: DUF4886 domain-containing protein [Thermoguttaceae bacterium]|nr:DUF4886 domain-containing protein [Thermoguttaceae bacterium]